jgi:vanillate/3-O-methylgallate O-demethylase
MSDQAPIPHSPYLPLDRDIALYNTAMGHLTPYEFSGWKSEEASWKRTAYLHAGLNPPMPYKLTGPGALQLLTDACINDFTVYSIGASKHAVMCNTAGHVMADGMVLRTGQEEFIAYFLSPYLDYLVETAGYDVTGEDLTGTVFLFQVGGPASLHIVEAATGEGLRDIDFLFHRPSQIRTEHTEQPAAVRIFRLGVVGTLAYEVHGDIADAPAVYQALLRAGEPYGVQQLDLRAYGMNHTQNGFAQSFLHFLPAWYEDADFTTYLRRTGGQTYDQILSQRRGSAGADITKRYASPLDLGWGHMVTFDHDFPGRQALQAAGDQHRRPVTLVWDPEDVLDVMASQFRPGADHQFMDWPANPVWTSDNSVVFADDVLVGDAVVGISSGRIFSHHYQAMLSLGLLEQAHAALGAQVEVLWGDPGTRQKRIRATVARFPYLDLPRNADIDVTTLPPTIASAERVTSGLTR